jgi:hypothetical protein
MPAQSSNPAEERTRTVVLVNAIENPDAAIDEATFQEQWRWLKTPRDWKPGDPLPTHDGDLDAVIVFSVKHHEDEIRRLCEAVRALPELAGIPLLAAVDKYQMALAHRMMETPNTDYIITPIEEGSLIANLNRAIASKP